MPNQAGIICNDPIHNSVAIGTTTIRMYVGQGVFYANEGDTTKPPPLIWANYDVSSQNTGRKVMAFCRTGVFITQVVEDNDFWPQFYRPHFSNRLT